MLEVGNGIIKVCHVPNVRDRTCHIPAFLCPASNPHRPLLPVRILLGKTFHLGQCVTCITQHWLGEDGKREQEAKDLIRNVQTQQITHVSTSSSCQRSLALPEHHAAARTCRNYNSALVSDHLSTLFPLHGFLHLGQ